MYIVYIAAMKPPTLDPEMELQNFNADPWHLVHIGVGTAIGGGCDGFDAQGVGQGVAHLRLGMQTKLGAITIHHQQVGLVGIS